MEINKFNSLKEIEKFNLLRRELNNKNVVLRKHPTEELYIYTYSIDCQIDRKWNYINIHARGIIFNKEGKLIAKPFPKFFNYGEPEAIVLNEKYKIYDKADGSLGILYFVKDVPYLATKGSFDSIQAQIGTRILHEKYKNTFKSLNTNYTYLFEIIYPQNRIVVDYGETEDIILIGVIETSTGIELNLEDFKDVGFNLIKEYTKEFETLSFEELKELDLFNKEGFIIKYENGNRLKLKFKEYLKLHAIITQISSNVIWKLMYNATPLDLILKNIPDEFYDWIKTTHDQILVSKYSLKSYIYSQLASIYSNNFKSKKEMYDYINNSYEGDTLSMLLSLYSGNDLKFKELLWENIKPELTYPTIQIKPSN